MSVSALAIDPVTPTTIYAGTNDGSGSVLKSTDGGLSWSVANSGLPNGDSTLAGGSLVIDPTAPTTLYVAGSSIYHGAGAVYKSTDGAATWTIANSGISSPFPIALAIDPSTPTNLYAATIDAGVFKSTDGAATWNAINNGLPVTILNCFVDALAVDPVTSSNVYAGMGRSTSTCYGVYKSTDGGTSWSAVNSGLPVQSSSMYQVFNAVLAIDPVTPTTLYTGNYYDLFESTNGGGSWSALNLTWWYVGGATSLVIDPRAPSNLYAGENGYIIESMDGGATWTIINSGMGASAIQALAIDSQGAKVFAGTSAGVFSTPAGQTLPPVFSLQTGTYNSPQTVTLSDATPGATIYYTTDGAPPTTSSTPYTGAITVNSTETINAIATASGYSTSGVSTATYTIVLPAATPTISIPTGSYTTGLKVTISDTTPGATIYYTTNNIYPTTSSTVYTGPITVSSSESIAAIATALWILDQCRGRRHLHYHAAHRQCRPLDSDLRHASHRHEQRRAGGDTQQYGAGTAHRRQHRRQRRLLRDQHVWRQCQRGLSVHHQRYLQTHCDRHAHGYAYHH